MSRGTGRLAARVMAMAVLCGMLGGCLAAAAAGGAAAGYGVARDERTVGQIANDARITTEVNARYVRDPAISALDINVDTTKAVVVLFGNVPSREIEQRAVQVAGAVKGVLRVESRLVIVPPSS